jgi:hypothetical protein
MDSNERQKPMDRKQMAAFVEDLIDSFEGYLGYREYWFEPAGFFHNWVQTAQPEWLPLAISLVGEYPNDYTPRGREHWDYFLMIMLEEWAQVEPHLVLTEMARLIEDPERRQTALSVFAGVNEKPLTEYLGPWVSRASELSDVQLIWFIEALGDNADPETNRLLLDLRQVVSADREKPRARLDYYIAKKHLTAPGGVS